MLFIDAVPAAGGAARELAFAASGTSTSELSTYTFTIAVPDPVAGREAIICLFTPFNAATGFTSVTLYGNTATNILTQQAGTHNIRVSMWRASIATGTTGNLVVTMNGSLWNCSADVFRAVNLGALNATGSLGYNSGGTAANSLNVNTTSGDCVIATAGVSHTGGPDVTWTGATKATERTVLINDRFSSAFINSGVTTETPRTVTATYPTAPNVFAGVSASFA